MLQIYTLSAFSVVLADFVVIPFKLSLQSKEGNPWRFLHPNEYKRNCAGMSVGFYE